MTPSSAWPETHPYPNETTLMRRRAPILLIAAAVLAAYAAGRATAAPVQTPMWVMMFTPGPAWDSTRAPNLQAHFGNHSANLARLRSERRIRLGGRFGPWGLILVDAESEAEARSYFASDSTLSSGVFRSEFYAWSTIYSGSVGTAPPER
jgi:hypothetical protein